VLVLVLVLVDIVIVMIEVWTSAVSGMFCMCLAVALDNECNKSEEGDDCEEDGHNCFRLWTTPLRV
jgi:hypothetical protein